MTKAGHLGSVKNVSGRFDLFPSVFTHFIFFHLFGEILIFFHMFLRILSVSIICIDFLGIFTVSLDGNR